MASTAITCPCGSDQGTHLTGVTTNNNSSDGNDRQVVYLAFDCEEGHTFVAKVNQHKGYTTLITGTTTAEVDAQV